MQIEDRKLEWRGRTVLVTATCLLLSGCLGAVVGTAVDVTLEVAKVPFKVAGAVVDVVTPDDEDDED
jgi:hypothetical protein